MEGRRSEVNPSFTGLLARSSMAGPSLASPGRRMATRRAHSSVAELAEHYWVARNTILKALRPLGDDGLIENLAQLGHLQGAGLAATRSRETLSACDAGAEDAPRQTFAAGPLLTSDPLGPPEWPPRAAPGLSASISYLVGDTGFEPVTFSVSGRRAPAAPIARDDASLPDLRGAPAAVTASWPGG
jgi:hypothetical protein